MIDDRLLLLLHAGATLYMTGLIWFVQIVHYPLFGRVPEGAFGPYEEAHVARTTWVVMPPMFLELGTAALLVVRHVSPVTVAGAALVALIWLGTFFLHVPQHNSLRAGFTVRTHRLLVLTNWTRTLAWTARGVLALRLLA